MIPTWKKALEKAKYGMSLVLDEELVADAEETSDASSSLSWYQFSEDFESRLINAGLR